MLYWRSIQNSKALFTYNESSITPAAVKSIFVPSFSNDEERQKLEEDILFNWQDFIDEAGEHKVENVHAFSLTDVEDGITDESVMKTHTITLKDIIMFLTGSYYLPVPSMKVKVCFDHTTKGRVNATNV